jgi:hypothetical protein
MITERWTAFRLATAKASVAPTLLAKPSPTIGEQGYFFLKRDKDVQLLRFDGAITGIKRSGGGGAGRKNSDEEKNTEVPQSVPAREPVVTEPQDETVSCNSKDIKCMCNFG